MKVKMTVPRTPDLDEVIRSLMSMPGSEGSTICAQYVVPKQAPPIREACLARIQKATGTKQVEIYENACWANAIPSSKVPVRIMAGKSVLNLNNFIVSLDFASGVIDVCLSYQSKTYEIASENEGTITATSIRSYLSGAGWQEVTA